MMTSILINSDQLPLSQLFAQIAAVQIRVNYDFLEETV